MHFAAATVFVLLPALTGATRFLAGPNKLKQATVASSDGPNEGNHVGDHNAGKGEIPGNNECGVSTFSELVQDEDDQPLVQDCKAMLADVKKEQSWEISCEGVTLVSYGTCSFNAKVAAGHCDKCAYVGNTDIWDLVTDSIDKFAPNATTIGCKAAFTMYVNAAGGMQCDSPDLPQGQQVDVHWTLTKADD